MAINATSAASEREVSTGLQTCSMNSGPVSISMLTKTLNRAIEANSRRLLPTAVRISGAPLVSRSLTDRVVTACPLSAGSPERVSSGRLKRNGNSRPVR